MAWTTVSTPPSWNVTDIELIQRLQYMLLENGNADANGTSLLTTMFTFQALVDALNLSQQRFMRDTGAILTRATQATTPQIARYTLPSDWIFTRRVTWQLSGGQIKSLGRSDSFELDNELNDWQQNFDVPVVYNDGSDLPTLTLEIAKAPSQIGGMELDYVGQPVTLNGVVGSPVKLTVPDECESAVLYGALAQLLGQDGEAYDPERAQYCESRYMLAVELTNALTGGGNGPVPTSA